LELRVSGVDPRQALKLVPPLNRARRVTLVKWHSRGIEDDSIELAGSSRQSGVVFRQSFSVSG
jgi:hypothetical protein